MKLSELKTNPTNPRTIKDDKFKKLVQSLKDFPEMMEKRPIVCVTDSVDGKLYPLGGNMRLKALQELKYKDIPDSWVMIADDWNEEQRKEFIIKDNVGFGEWDWDLLESDWSFDDLENWGLDLPVLKNENDDEYTTKVQSPIYKPKKEKPSEIDLYDLRKYNELVEEIENAELNEDEKEFLINAAKRHIIFNYAEIAEYYAHASKSVQELMENSALIIIDYDKAIEKGFVKLYNFITELSETDE